jgi:hypothetical protein
MSANVARPRAAAGSFRASPSAIAGGAKAYRFPLANVGRVHARKLSKCETTLRRRQRLHGRR